MKVQAYTVYDEDGRILRTGRTMVANLQDKFGERVLPFMVENPKAKRVVNGKVVLYSEQQN